MIPTSRKGNGDKKATHTQRPVGEDLLSELLPITTGRPGDALLLERWHFEQRGGIAWHRTVRGPWTAPVELVRHWAAIRAIVGLPQDVVPYALRHSSIVRLIVAGLPVALVASLHDTSPAMLASNYMPYITDALTRLAAGAVVPLVPQDGRNA